MRLADFLLREPESILREWEAFAATNLPGGAQMDSVTLRDHAPDMLRAMALDLQTAQSAEEQDIKAKGRAALPLNAAHTAAQAHAILRARDGLNIVQMATEYRALRASVLRLWADAALRGATDMSTAIEDMTRFNEAVDQALMESVDFFNREVERSRNLFLGVVGHDLRNPLATIQNTAGLLATLRDDPVVSQAAARLIRSGARMKSLLDDLLDYNRATLATGMQIQVADMDLAELCATEVQDLKTTHAGRKIELTVSGDTHGRWDAARLQQLLSNLLINALVHGSADAPIHVRVNGTPAEVGLVVQNHGAAIPREVLAHIFEPLKRGMSDLPATSTHLGLGLFIAREIAKAHGGDIAVSSNDSETLFSVRLPHSAS